MIFERFFFVICFLTYSNILLHAQGADDKVIITNRSDLFTFFKKDGQMMVHHEVKEDYMLNSKLDQPVTPFIIYGNGNQIKLEKASCPGHKAHYRNITSKNVFFDDTQMCFFDVVLTSRKPRCTAKFSRTISDARLCANIDLSSNYFTQVRSVSLFFPKDMSQFHPVLFNIEKDIQVDTMQTAEGTKITYTLHNCKPEKEEEMMPPHDFISPQILITGAFRDYHELYTWLIHFTEVDTVIPKLDSLLHEIRRNCNTSIDCLRHTYQWVQRNIRYVAFEAGETGFQPDRPSEVLRKRYSDCKGMSMLLRTLLRAQGFDARLTYTATKDIPYKISEYPTLASSDHMICTVFFQGKTYYLDATHTYIPLDYIPQGIQGQEAMIEDGDGCIIQDVPLLPASESTDSIYCQYELSAEGQITGWYTRTMSGDIKEQFLLAHPNDTTAFAGNADTGSIILRASKELYLDLNPRKDVGILKIDTLKRENNAWFPLRNHFIRKVQLHLPPNYQVKHLPKGITQNLPQGQLSCSFQQDNDTIIYEQHIQINAHQLSYNEIPTWNEAIDCWTKVCNEQIILIHKD